MTLDVYDVVHLVTQTQINSTMTQEQTITPFIDLVKQWSDDWHKAEDNDVDLVLYVALQATRWGADQELEACCVWLRGNDPYEHDYHQMLRAARRPKPPSLKELALLQLDTLNADLAMHGMGCDLSQIRRALEQLDD